MFNNINKQIIGNIGLYYSAFKLSTLGFNVMVTSRNAKGADLIAVSENEKKFIGIQVKTNSSEMDIRLTSNFSHPTVDYWIIIYNVFNNPNSFIIPAEDILKSHSNLINKPSLNGSILVCADNVNKNGPQNFWIYKKFLIKDKELCKNNLPYKYYENWDILLK